MVKQEARCEKREAFAATALLLAMVLLALPLTAQATVGSTATPITITDLDGALVRLDAKAAGKPLLIEFWATWCEVCEALLPGVRQAATRFGSRVDFVGVNVTINESKARVRRWVERERPPYRTLYDESGLAVRTFQAPVTSYVVIIDANGIIRYTGVGEEQDLVKALEGVLSK
jgi:cytochrome c biogenesis protein CcmG/thiol:disulfide interchange protein DsbE